MKRFVVGVSGLTKEDETSFIEYLRGQRILWWHWIPEFWLLADESDTASEKSIRDHLHQMQNSRRAIVLSVGDDTIWSGFGPKSKDADMFAWLKSIWRPEE